MKATYQSQPNEESVIYIAAKKIGCENEWAKMIKIAAKLESYGYATCHHDEMEMIMLTGDTDFTIAQMKEDYAMARKAA